MKHIKLIFAGFLVGTLAFSSCASDYLETTPTNQISEASLTTADALYVALNGIHRKMVSSDRSIQGQGGEPGMIVCREANGDDMTWDTQTWHQSYLNWTMNVNVTSSYNAAHWWTYYEFILNCNKILEAIENLSETEANKAMAKYVEGETRAFRAWSHFQLVQYYAQRYDATKTNTQWGVPIKTSSESEALPRNTVEEVYTFINQELKTAAPLLKGYTPVAVNHYSEKVVYGIMARVALAQQNYSAAAEYAAECIKIAEAEGHKIMTLDQANPALTPLVFANITSETKDALYAAMPNDDQAVGFYSFYANMSWNFNSGTVRTGIKQINSKTYNLMSETDVRRAWWDPTGDLAGPSSAHNTRPYQTRKFTARGYSNNLGDFAFMRLTEIYLMAAEAYARAGDTPKAKEYFSVFIAERDPDYKDLGNTGDAFAEEVMNHRRIELWGEGFRFWDLKRLGLPNDRRDSNFAVAFCGFLLKEPTDNGWAYEIPQIETNYNDWYDEPGRTNY